MTEIVQMDSNTWRIEDGFVRFFLLAGSDKAVMIDSGVQTPDAYEIAKGLTDLPVMLVNTHGDGDHVSGTGSFSEIHISPEDYINCGIKERFPQTEPVFIKDGDLIDLGERTLEIISIPGHTKGSIAILDVNKRMLYAGDSVQSGNIYMFGDKRDPDRFEESLNKLISIKDRYDIIVASHDEPLIQKDYVDFVLDCWLEVRKDAVPYTVIDLHGRKVKFYNVGHCGFYCE